MNTSRYEELVSLYMDGEPTEEQLNELAQLLAEDESLANDFRQQLTNWEAWSQAVAPERSSDAFLAGLETRLRAEEDAVVFKQSAIRKAKRPLLLQPIMAIAATAAILLSVSLLIKRGGTKPTETAQTEHMETVPTEQMTKAKTDHNVCMHAEGVCTRCTLRQTARCSRAIRYVGNNGQPRIALLAETPSMRQVGGFCLGPKPVMVKGLLKEKDGQMWLATTSITLVDN